MSRWLCLLAAAGSLAGCAGNVFIDIHCAPQLDQATVESSVAASCGSTTIYGNTPTATATTTVPVTAPIGPGAGFGLGLQNLPPLTGAMVVPMPPMAPMPDAIAAPRRKARPHRTSSRLPALAPADSANFHMRLLPDGSGEWTLPENVANN